MAPETIIIFYSHQIEIDEPKKEFDENDARGNDKEWW